MDVIFVADMHVDDVDDQRDDESNHHLPDKSDDPLSDLRFTQVHATSLALFLGNFGWKRTTLSHVLLLMIVRVVRTRAIPCRARLARHTLLVDMMGLGTRQLGLGGGGNS